MYHDKTILTEENHIFENIIVFKPMLQQDAAYCP